VDLTGTFIVHADTSQAPANPVAAPAAGKVGAIAAPTLTAGSSAVKLAQQ